jgi:hypothetical protein
MTGSVRKIRGRPKLVKPYPNVGLMRISEELKGLLEAEKGPRETMGECALRLIRERGKKVIALRKELDQVEARQNKNIPDFVVQHQQQEQRVSI